MIVRIDDPIHKVKGRLMDLNGTDPKIYLHYQTIGVFTVFFIAFSLLFIPIPGTRLIDSLAYAFVVSTLITMHIAKKSEGDQSLRGFLELSYRKVLGLARIRHRQMTYPNRSRVLHVRASHVKIRSLKS